MHLFLSNSKKVHYRYISYELEKGNEGPDLVYLLKKETSVGQSHN